MIVGTLFNAKEAIEVYKRAFGAEVTRLALPRAGHENGIADVKYSCTA